jgi:hypothetical protein
MAELRVPDGEEPLAWAVRTGRVEAGTQAEEHLRELQRTEPARARRLVESLRPLCEPHPGGARSVMTTPEGRPVGLAEEPLAWAVRTGRVRSASSPYGQHIAAAPTREEAVRRAEALPAGYVPAEPPPRTVVTSGPLGTVQVRAAGEPEPYYLTGLERGLLPAAEEQRVAQARAAATAALTAEEYEAATRAAEEQRRAGQVAASQFAPPRAVWTSDAGDLEEWERQYTAAAKTSRQAEPQRIAAMRTRDRAEGLPGSSGLLG